MAHFPRWMTLWIALNLAGMAFYLKVASVLWVHPGEEGTPGGPGDGFYSLVCVLPILMVYSVINFVAFVLSLRQLLRTQNSENKVGLVICVCLIVLWTGTVAFDQYRSFRVIDRKYVDVRSEIGYA